MMREWSMMPSSETCDAYLSWVRESDSVVSYEDANYLPLPVTSSESAPSAVQSVSASESGRSTEQTSN